MMGAILKNGVNYTGGGGSGTDDYSELINKPQINGITLSGNKTPEALGLVTKAVDDLVNYYKKTETYTKGEVDAIATAIKNSRFEVVATLPTSDIKTNVIYLVPKAESESGDIKDEYINLDGTTAGWERIGSTDIDLSGYVTTTALNTALANYTTTTDLMALLAGKQDKVQYSALPTPSAELEGKIFEYTGATGGGLTHGYFYECVSDGESTPTYSWQQTNVQPSSGGGGGGHTIEDSEGTDLTQRDTLQFGEGFKAEDDSTNEKTVISPDVMQSGDISDVITPLPSVGNKMPVLFDESGAERVVGWYKYADGTKKPVYQKTIDCGTLPNNTSKSISYNVPNADKVFITEGFAYADSICLNMPHSSATGAQYNIEAYLVSGNIYIETKYNYSSYSGYVTIQYTKTTDTPNT